MAHATVREIIKVISEEQFYPWQKEVYNIIKQEPTDRHITWVWDPKGSTGKSAFAKWLFVKRPDLRPVIISGKANDCFNAIKTAMDTVGAPRVVILDVPKQSGDFVSVTALEAIKNGLLYSGKYEGGSCIFNPPHVIVFSNQGPPTDKMTADRFIVVSIDKNTRGLGGEMITKV